ncbi:MaoC family dehydratase [Zafaria sp. Z1313]|uniref:MaoC family dehydratase n=1 Tax=unclassified Zafaria TaxID=2828765 RepID=UPI002E77701A|nr:MaoC/PaaZ C-terminal domain-containing protein [Zafaria sp. J156]MEE1621228.1 MaoC/PaaZ C-terminal domain-containing protein [Zafaria sp. J156]
MSRRIVQLDAAPSLPSLYAAAAGGHLARLAGRGRETPGALPETEHRVAGVRADPARVVAYQRLMGDTVRDTLPSVFVHGLAFPVAMGLMAERSFPLPLLGMVHLANRVDHARPLAVSGPLEVRAWAEELAPHHAGTRVDLVSEVHNGDGPAWRGTSTYLAKGVWAGERPERPARDDAGVAAPARTGAWRLGPGTGRDYAAVLGDYNPIHLSAASARALGLKRQIAHGMYLAGRALASTAPVEGGYRWEITFEAPVFLPGTVQFAARPDGGRTGFSGWDGRTGRRHFRGSVEPTVAGA